MIKLKNTRREIRVGDTFIGMGRPFISGAILEVTYVNDTARRFCTRSTPSCIAEEGRCTGIGYKYISNDPGVDIDPHRAYNRKACMFLDGLKRKTLRRNGIEKVVKEDDMFVNTCDRNE